MTKPESLPVEEARKKFADVLDGTQFRSTHTEITRRGKPAGYVVPPEWYARAVEALKEMSAAPMLQAPPREPRRAPVPQSLTRAPKPEPTVEGRPLTDEEAKEFAVLALGRASEMQKLKLQQLTANTTPGYEDFAVVSTALDLGLLTHDEVYGERPVSSEETNG
ncbi:type II toxin-antitoxin system Phd/YefM family antitoxin [Streptomyces scabiei]|uniref:type II toxin-antitoxin system Phd/YefM family antitoxin n=1 Tax=Streptomyces scabiei TaxID=1930 RepID=UPI001B30A34A|nr:MULTISPECIES: type II toxin-antitoxin system Phd/YefM family antitoxin [Streptomyces]MBP5870869.1 type II toxin-antitoxin system Phd/YefM family antitoxin [Streptomyces sp. LBUM 1485]MBP5913227.1 type II toxin-antitoxin system Phd/YefM family antitoxin [Streptomyces sp. LBUM 1486]MDX2532304.1 type II toxin-antitoxin system Phd/YefM family antitoxin [Streptomyces scabiei]MDX2794610.1 type II toxin-antitoxin system Phd/YefM family antitoxin [Streptomyces scabiei]MDX3822388.1 type II toxin-ant